MSRGELDRLLLRLIFRNRNRSRLLIRILIEVDLTESGTLDLHRFTLICRALEFQKNCIGGFADGLCRSQHGPDRLIVILHCLQEPVHLHVPVTDGSALTIRIVQQTFLDRPEGSLEKSVPRLVIDEIGVRTVVHSFRILFVHHTQRFLVGILKIRTLQSRFGIEIAHHTGNAIRVLDGSIEAVPDGLRVIGCAICRRLRLAFRICLFQCNLGSGSINAVDRQVVVLLESSQRRIRILTEITVCARATAAVSASDQHRLHGLHGFSLGTLLQVGIRFCRRHRCAVTRKDRSYIVPNVIHGLSILPAPMLDIRMIAAQAKRMAAGMINNRRHRESLVVDCVLRIDTKHPAEISCHLTGFLIHSIEVAGIVQTIFADFELYMRIVAGAFATRAATPRAVIPGHRLHSSNRTVCQLTDPEVQPRLHFFMVPVITILILTQAIQPFGSVRSFIIRLDISLQPWIVRASRMPQHTLRCKLPGAFIAGALSHHANQRLVLIVILHGFLLSPACQRGFSAKRKCRDCGPALQAPSIFPRTVTVRLTTGIS